MRLYQNPTKWREAKEIPIFLGCLSSSSSWDMKVQLMQLPAAYIKPYDLNIICNLPVCQKTISTSSVRYNAEKQRWVDENWYQRIHHCDVAGNMWGFQVMEVNELTRMKNIGTLIVNFKAKRTIGIDPRKNWKSVRTEVKFRSFYPSYQHWDKQFWR